MSTATAVKERPILFSGPMVTAIRAGRKTQTRRVMKPQPEHWRCQAPGMEDIGGLSWKGRCYEADSSEDIETACPYGEPGDRLWVRETWATGSEASGNGYSYRADREQWKDRRLGGPDWRPSIHMPRRACRILLEVAEIRVERLHDITLVDAKAEGVECPEGQREENYWGGHLIAFRELWEGINGEGSWERNDWLWVVGFRVLEGLA